MENIELTNGRKIGIQEVPYFIGEIGINHNGDISLAKKLIDMCVSVGIDCVKFQKRDYKTTIRKKYLNRKYENENSFGRTYGEHKKFLEFSNEQLKELYEYTKQKHIDFCCSGFDLRTYDYIEKEFNPLFHKIPSPLVVNLELLEHVAEYQKPIFMATGMVNLDEIINAVKVIQKVNKKLVLMQCTSLYPTEDREVNLMILKEFQNKFKTLVGFSSHDKSVVFPAVAHALGACVIEKHITLDRTMKGPDHSSSFEKRGLELSYNYLISTHYALGSSEKYVLDREIISRQKHLQSIVAARKIEKGSIIKRDDLTFMSPGDGVLPYEIDMIIGKTLIKDKKVQDLILWEDIYDK